MYYVTERKDCHECGGTGWIRNPAWDEFWNEKGAEIEAAERMGDPVAVNKIMDRIFIDFWGNTRGEPEEFECPECDGTGIIAREVPLEEALFAVLHKT